MAKMLASIKKQRQPFWILIGAVFVIFIGVLDYLSGREIAFSLFYLIPIVLVTWFTGKPFGFIFSVFSAILWLIADIYSGQTYSHAFIPYWNAVVRLSFFIIVMFLFAALKGLEQEKQLARSDDLTGAANRRFFLEMVQREIERTRRYKRPFTIAYIDVDNFKIVNDKFGHIVGDQALCAIVEKIRENLRKTDIVGRLGGDEFACLLIETGSEEAKTVVSKTQLALMEEMRKNDWPVTFSIGVLTCTDVPWGTDELIRRVDDLMYSVKHTSKNGVRYGVFEN